MRREGRRVLVAGGAGFLGSHLCDALLARGDAVLCVDDFSTGSRGNIAHLDAHPRFDLLRHDVTLPLSVEVDEIYNLACPASPLHYQRNPVQTTRTAVLGALNLLDLAGRRGVKILQASSSEIYGDPTRHPQDEGYNGNVNPIGPRACYSEGLRCAETLFFDHHRQGGLRIRIARIFNTYGPRMHPDDGRVVSSFVARALRGEPVTLFGGGTQTRSFCYVGDLVEGLLRLMDAPDEVTGPVNLGDPREVTIREIAELACHLAGSTAPLEHRPLPQDDPMQRCPDITRARALLGWEPRTTLEEGMARTVASFRQVLGNA
ncbi:SDR family oxidoreductase [Roseomonas sp. GC11]|uniref:UDP-glucuronic acid decarboxylase family protein n=1 Tax=Roseomonas sp. GC11 TaxID=2950546 RepID=UPI00210C589E|nr:UDP-glucuronic acid decarboxylase family protein [Roseomonas sp. GC11]MCQ4160394.1 SDR family oxidoreductase [Roseomonas sp. GC11]